MYTTQQLAARKKEAIPTLKAHKKPTCPSPPQVLKDKRSQVQFTKGQFLGEGGFARCYEVWDSQGERYAAKVVPKSALKTEKTKAKLFAEIKIHQSVSHRNIVKFQHVFEDSQNVYMILELCENRSLVEMLKKRKHFTEAECRYYMVALMDALIYLQRKNIIHRDLKLGNLFLTKDMDIRIGDFGLATIVMKDERKKTICGTPNYIAPEVLFDREFGHSYEVDIWSMGVVMYTLLVGKPPFQTKDVKEIYQNIKHNRYEFSADCQITPMAKDLITKMLAPNAVDRPSASEVFHHPWCAMKMPVSIPITALTVLPVLEFQKEVIVLTDSPLVSSGSKGSSFARRAPLSDVNARPQTILRKKVTVGEQNSPVLAKPSIINPNSAVAISPAVEQLRRMAIKETPTKSLQSKVQISPAMASNEGVRRTMLETMLYHLKDVLGCIKADTKYEGFIAPSLVATPKVFISKWIDYSNKYGLGYQLTNGHIGVFFNDSSSIILSANDNNFEYLEYAKGSEKTVMNRHGYTLDNYPEGIQKKAILLKHFKGYMTQNLAKASNYTFQDVSRTTNMDFLVKYIRTKHAVMFRLTNRVVQINFFDHSKLILSQDGQVVTFIDREKELSTFALNQVQSRQKSDVVSRLKYAADILESLTSGKQVKNP